MLLSELLLTFKTTESTKYHSEHPPLHFTSMLLDYNTYNYLSQGFMLLL